MISWGISANSHDAALAVFCDEKLAFASHSERFSGVKNDPDLNHYMVDYARERWGNPDQIYWYEHPTLKSFRQFFAGQGFKFRENNVKKYLERYHISAPIKYTGHHHSHAAAGYHTSGFDDACVVVVDAIGEFETLTVWKGEGTALRKVYKTEYPHSVGLWYSAMTQRVGLKPNEEEYILMGMAAYGDPTKFYKELLDDFIWYPDPVEDGNILYVRENLHRGCKSWRPELSSEQDMFDLAASTQAVYENIFEKILSDSRRMVNSENLVLMGGCALNCKANPIAYKYYKNVFIMPNPGDAGSAVGAVLAHKPAWRYIQPQPFNPFLGFDMGYHATEEAIVDYLIENKICGIARGPAEFGPRALGNRSLIADPRGYDIKDRVNEIKQRQKFRPFAPAILSELSNDYFDIPGGRSPYMQVVADCRYPELFPAIVHADGTSRVQTVEADGSPFRRLLEIWYKRTGCPMLLNTSLNIKGEPMVNDHKDAERFSEKYGLPVFN